jgi:DNA-binding NarL/FixJ family response regulator
MKRTLSVRLDEEDLEKLGLRADQVGLTSSTLARLLIRDSIAGMERQLLASNTPIPPQADANHGKGSSTRAMGSPLTPREAEVLSKIAGGQTNQRIAHTLDVSLETIKKDLASIIQKLSASDRTHAVVLAIRQGHIRPEN